MRTIVKIQRPLDEGSTALLVYNEARTVFAMVAPTPEIDALFPDGSVRVFAETEIDEGRLKTEPPGSSRWLRDLRPVEDQDW